MRDFIKILIASALLAINISSCDKIDNTDSIDDVNNVEDTGPAIGVSKMEGWAGDYISIASAQMLKGVTFAPVTEGAIASEQCATVLRGDRLWLGLYTDAVGNPIDCEIKLTATSSDGEEISTIVKSKMWEPVLVKYGPDEVQLPPTGPLYDGDYYATGILNSSGRYLMLDGGKGNVWDSSISVSCDWWIDYGYHQPWDTEYENNVWILFYIPTNQVWDNTRMIYQCGCLTRILEPEILQVVSVREGESAYQNVATWGIEGTVLTLRYFDTPAETWNIEIHLGIMMLQHEVEGVTTTMMLKRVSE